MYQLTGRDLTQIHGIGPILALRLIGERGTDMMHVAAVPELYSRRIAGWSMHDSMTSQLVVDALMMGVWRRGKPTASEPAETFRCKIVFANDDCSRLIQAFVLLHAARRPLTNKLRERR